MKIWLAAALCAWTLTAAAQTAATEQLYVDAATVAAGRQVDPKGPEVKQMAKYLKAISAAYNVTEANAVQTASAGMNILRPRVPGTNLFELLDAAQRLAPSEHGHDRAALVHALTTYIAARSQGVDTSHEEAIKIVTDINNKPAPK
ncbi:MAG TPA: hypothetical protein VH105_13155 [Burkholderiales bacterium]|jgi:hypothetical protein|nr:hypothetical protein [Burkholderiales bacterium]